MNSGANFLRSRIARETIEYDFHRALALALDLAQSREAMALPGWLGLASIDAVRRFRKSMWAGGMPASLIHRSAPRVQPPPSP